MKQEDEKKTIAEILNMVNSPFVGILNENDKIIRQILEELMRNPELADAIRANNSRDVLVNICRQKFDDTIVDQIEKYFHLKELLEKEKGLEQMLINKILDNLGLQISASRNLIYDEAVLRIR